MSPRVDIWAGLKFDQPPPPLSSFAGNEDTFRPSKYMWPALVHANSGACGEIIVPTTSDDGLTLVFCTSSCSQQESVHIVMDRGEIDLYEFFDDGMAENDVRVIMKVRGVANEKSCALTDSYPLTADHSRQQLLSAIAFCHQNAFAHRDLKPEVTTITV